MKRKFVTRSALVDNDRPDNTLRTKDVGQTNLSESSATQNMTNTGTHSLVAAKGPFNTSIGIKKPLGKTSMNTALSGKRVFNTKIGEVGIVTAVEQVEKEVLSSTVRFELGNEFEFRPFDDKNLTEMRKIAGEASRGKLEALKNTLLWKVDMPIRYFQGQNLREIESRFKIEA